MIEHLHGFTHFRTLGGVEGILRQYLEDDPRHGLASRVLAYFDARRQTDPRVRGLGLSGWHNVRVARRRFRAAWDRSPEVMTYHNLWGMTFFADLDQAGRRLGLLHSPFDLAALAVRQLGDLLDGLLVVSRPLQDLARRELPHLEEERVALLPNPVARTEASSKQAALVGRPLLLGYAGRLRLEEKRVDRLVELVKRLEAKHLAFRLEILGEGPQGPWLRQQLGNHPHVVFHGRRSGDAYWATLANWDVIIFTSDVEGMPIALLEALSVGVLPVFPAINSGGDDYTRQVAPNHLYAPGNLEEAVAVIQRLASLPEPAIHELRERAMEVVQPHLGDRSDAAFAQFVRTMQALPRLSPTATARTPQPTDVLPFGLLRRLYPRQFWQSLQRRSSGAMAR